MRKEVLDHGYVELIETWGSDERIIEAARMSTGKGFLGWGPFCSKCGISMVAVHGGGFSPADYEHGEQNGCEHDATKLGDEKLLKFLWENKHATPFEMAGATFEVQAPIFVFREWHRHRVPFGYNEMSARYTPLPDVNYIPTLERLMIGSDGKNKQAGTIKDAAVLTNKKAELFRSSLEQIYKDQQRLYEDALQAGIPKELARIHLPVGRYSRMRATGNLRGWLAFLTLRLAPQAQCEIRRYAQAVDNLIGVHFPRTHELFVSTLGR